MIYKISSIQPLCVPRIALSSDKKVYIKLGCLQIHFLFFSLSVVKKTTHVMQIANW